MKIYIVIANPPYSVGSNHICEKIDNEIKAKNPKSFISVQPIYRTTTYKTAEQIKNVFLYEYKKSKLVYYGYEWQHKRIYEFEENAVLV